jgi:hypothetical protein
MKALEWAGMGGGVGGDVVADGSEDMGRGLELVCFLFLAEIPGKIKNKKRISVGGVAGKVLAGRVSAVIEER